MNVNDIKFRIYGGLGHGLAYLGASRKSLVRGGRCTALVVAIVLASQGAAWAAGAPSGTRVSEPEALAGPPGPVRPPRTFEQLDVFGKSSMSVPRSIVDHRWSPGSNWNNNTDLNNFDPSRWYPAPIDPSWKPEPAFSEDDDVTNFNPSRWQKGTVDRNWYPKDGFKRQDESSSSE